METRFQYILLKFSICLKIVLLCLTFFGTASSALAKEGKNSGKLRINSELFDIGVTTGIINIEDFPSEFIVGANITFKASENFFLQYNYVQASVSNSAFENNPAFTTLDLGDDRDFTHFDLLVGYNIFQGEFFASEDRAHLSSLYVVGGVGDTDFGGEDDFTYTIGVGYQIEFFRRYLLRFDYRDYIYQTSLVVGDDEDTVHNTQISVGLGYLF